MQITDIYDQMPDGDSQRANNKRRLAELERDGAERRRRIASVLEVAESTDPSRKPPLL
ncbi:MAG: hypothetical protein ACLPTJ_10385 [Solirubrobacteraceae bacterium]